MRVLTIVGTRPEAIKLAPVIRRLERDPELIQSTVCVTAQHREMLDQVLQLFQIKADFDLDLMSEGQTLPGLTASVLTAVTDVLDEARPDVVVVQGDTTTAMVGALASFYKQIAVGHVEAGLRTNNRYNPFPEEMNRRLVTALASLHFAPTQTAVEALLAEGVPRATVFLTGNPVVDALRYIVGNGKSTDIGLPLRGDKLILVTAHRRENFGGPLEDICSALEELAARNEDVDIVYPVHLNPSVREPVHRLLSNQAGIHLLPPLDYMSLVSLMDRSEFVMTDSGGIQEEAPALGKPVLVLRTTTERPEGVEAGTAKLIGTAKESIIDHAERLLRDRAEYRRMATAVSPYGDGQAAEEIVRILVERFAARRDAKTSAL
ncbi:MAG: UDP-N-acetylglucosamine 2-epimerase (non-hydrolyzing) [Chloroflexota bacterium]|nr:MAG: UDP-N-acetylglucosamine 2-epimerase (non-hydrolyzing) [Chloroflexota bacterium]